MNNLKDEIAVVTAASKGIVTDILKRLTKKVLLTTAVAFATLGNVEAQNVNNLEITTTPNETAMHNFYLRYIEAANSRDFETIASMINDEVLLNGKKTSKEESIAGFKQIINEFPDHIWHIEDLFIESDRIAVRLRNTGTPKETSSFGKNPKNISVEYTEYATYKIRDGQFAEMWWLVDIAKIKKQLKNTRDSKALDVVNRFFDKFKSGASPEELANFFNENAELYIPGDTKNVPWIGKRTGRKEIANHFRLLKKYIQPEKLSFTDIVTKDNRVVVLGYLESRMKRNGNVMKSEFSIDIVVKNGLISRYHLLEDSFKVSGAVKPL